MPTSIILRDREQILACEPLLQAFGALTGQNLAAYWLSYFAGGGFFRRLPVCVLITHQEWKGAGLPTAEDLLGIGLLDEFHARGHRTKAFSSDDRLGFRSIFARPQDRARVAALVAEALLEKDAHVVYLLYENESNTRPEQFLSRGGNVHFLSREREVSSHLALSEDYDATLMSLGKKTRFNLGYYRRRLAKEIPSHPISDALAVLDAATFRAIHDEARDPIEPVMCDARWDAAQKSGSFIFGLRADDGRWLGLIGGWRHEDQTVLAWQTNIRGMDQLSIGTIVRSYWIEDECHRGTRALFFHNSTPHSIVHSFQTTRVREFAMRRNTAWSRLLVLAAKRYLRYGNVVLQTPIAVFLRDETVKWRPQRRRRQKPLANGLDRRGSTVSA